MRPNLPSAIIRSLKGGKTFIQSLETKEEEEKIRRQLSNNLHFRVFQALKEMTGTTTHRMNIYRAWQWPRAGKISIHRVKSPAKMEASIGV